MCDVTLCAVVSVVSPIRIACLPHHLYLTSRVQEYGITPAEKFDIGCRIGGRLMRKISSDIVHATHDQHDEDHPQLLEALILDMSNVAVLDFSALAVFEELAQAWRSRALCHARSPLSSASEFKFAEKTR